MKRTIADSQPGRVEVQAFFSERHQGKGLNCACCRKTTTNSEIKRLLCLLQTLTDLVYPQRSPSKDVAFREAVCEDAHRDTRVRAS